MLMILIGLVGLMAWSTHPSASGRTLRRWLIEGPAAWLNRVGRWRLVVIGLSIAAMVAAVGLLDAEGVLAMSYTLSEGVGLFLAFDVATWVEVYAVVWLLSATRMARVAIAQAKRIVAEVLRRVPRLAARRAPRSERPSRRPPTAALYVESSTTCTSSTTQRENTWAAGS